MEKNVQKGGGVISNPKNFIANLRKLTHIYKLSQKKAQCNFQKGMGRGVKAVWTFFKKTSKFESTVVPIQVSKIKDASMHASDMRTRGHKIFQDLDDRNSISQHAFSLCAISWIAAAFSGQISLNAVLLRSPLKIVHCHQLERSLPASAASGRLSTVSLVLWYV